MHINLQIVYKMKRDMGHSRHQADTNAIGKQYTIYVLI